ncbi:MAG: aldose 1-epimerase family protein [Oscillospiraceae bacterium]
MEHIISNGILQVAVNDLGAELMSVKAHGIEYLWQRDKKYWKDSSVTIFPYVARLTDGKYKYDGKIYELPIHGFAPESVFELASYTESSMVFRLVSDDGTRECYPFEFEFLLTYRLEKNTLKIIYTVKNLDSKRMFFGTGAHPGFNVPLECGQSFSDWKLVFEPECQAVRIGFSEDCFISGEDEPFELDGGTTLSLSHSLFDDDAIVLKNMSEKVKLCSDKSAHSVEAEYPNMPYLGIWHMPKTDAGYVCIEPWTSLPSRKGIIEDISEQKNLIKLDAGEIFEAAITYSFL